MTQVWTERTGRTCLLSGGLCGWITDTFSLGVKTNVYLGEPHLVYTIYIYIYIYIGGFLWQEHAKFHHVHCYHVSWFTRCPVFTDCLKCYYYIIIISSYFIRVHRQISLWWSCFVDEVSKIRWRLFLVDILTTSLIGRATVYDTVAFVHAYLEVRFHIEVDVSPQPLRW